MKSNSWLSVLSQSFPLDLMTPNPLTCSHRPTLPAIWLTVGSSQHLFHGAEAQKDPEGSLCGLSGCETVCRHRPEVENIQDGVPDVLSGMVTRV